MYDLRLKTQNSITLAVNALNLCMIYAKFNAKLCKANTKLNAKLCKIYTQAEIAQKFNAFTANFTEFCVC